MNAINVMTDSSTSTPRESVDAVWQRAKKRDIQRLPAILLAAVIFMFVAFLVDTSTWPLTIDTGRWAIAAIAAGVFFALMLALSVRQKTASAERYVSPLGGLESDERRVARADLSAAHPASDSLLREVEIARARQLTTYGPSSLGTALIPTAFQAVAAVIMFVSGSPVLGGLFVLSTAVNGWSAWKSSRNTQDARRFLDVLALPHS